MKYTAISQYQPFLFIKLATPFHFVRLSKMSTLNKSLCGAALLAVAATSSFAAETQVVETTQNAAPASEAAASDAVATSEAQAN